tara:strand:+ start:4750 stop:5868 length:1119 start_codon:yes stop_codon:yes gene_type:complete
MIKTIVSNIFVTLAMIGALILTPPSIYYSSKVLEKFNSCNQDAECEIDERNNLSIYDEYSWSNIHFKEFEETWTDEYEDYVGWSRADFMGQTITIENGFRRTIEPKEIKNGDVWFFGGSTLWGTGSNDENTIPSIFALKTKTLSKNYGETGYRMRQNLNRLIDIVFKWENTNENNEVLVVMYGGAVDIFAGCSITNDGISTTREEMIKATINSNKDRFTIQKTFNQLIQFIQRVLPASKNNDDKFDCHNDKNKAHSVSNEIYQSVKVSSEIASLNGFDFIYIIEPIVSEDLAKINKIPFSANQIIQAHFVIPTLKSLLDSNNIPYLDFSNALEDCLNCVIDDTGHLSPVGNDKIASKTSDWFLEYKSKINLQ